MRRITLLAAMLAAVVAIASTASAEPQAKKAGAAATASAAAPVNLNTATQAQLESLPGIGAASAKRIIEYRQKNAFKKIEELMNVKGIGEKSFLKLKPLITVGPDKADKPSGER
jgi:competence protein ComEA